MDLDQRSLKFKSRLFVWLTLTFMLFTVIGTLSHECGHWIVAEALGRQAEINYRSTRFIEENEVTVRDWPTLAERQLIRAGGPLQTMITGTAGFLLILHRRSSFLKAQELKVGQWLLVFLSLFWLRQIFYLLVFLADWAISGKPPMRGDEVLLEAYQRMPPFSIIGTTAVMGLLITLTVIFRFIPKPQRFIFMLAGLIGGGIGYYLWFILIGPAIMP